MSVMANTKCMVYGGGRWRELDLTSGRVSGWGDASFMRVRRGRLEAVPRVNVLRALRALAGGRPSAARDGPRLTQLRKNVKRVGTEHEVSCQGHKREPCMHNCCHQHNLQCSTDANFNSLLKTSTNTVAVQCEPVVPTGIHTIKQTNPKNIQYHTDDSPSEVLQKIKVIQRTKCKSHRNKGNANATKVAIQKENQGLELSTSDSEKQNTHADKTTANNDPLPISCQAAIVISSDNELHKKGKLKGPKGVRDDASVSHDTKKPKVVQQKSKNSGLQKTKGHKSKQTDSKTQSQDPVCKELLIAEEDVMLLRNFLEKDHDNIFDVDLLHFDADDRYKAEVFYKLNPLVNLVRCARIASIIRAREKEPTSHRRAPPEPTSSRRAPPEPTNSRRAPPEPTNSRRAPPEPTSSRRAPPEPTSSRRAPPEPTSSRRAPPEPTSSRRAPPEPTSSRRAPPEPTSSRRAPPEPTSPRRDCSSQADSVSLKNFITTLGLLSVDDANASQHTRYSMRARQSDATKAPTRFSDDSDVTESHSADASEVDKENIASRTRTSRKNNNDSVLKESKSTPADNKKHSEEIKSKQVVSNQVASKEATTNRVTSKQTSSKEIGADAGADNISITRRSARNSKVQKTNEDLQPNKNNRQQDKPSTESCSASGWRAYSQAEDAFVVGWVRGERRAHAVNGNRLWRLLEPVHRDRTGCFRSWHSLRNRYLRHLLPSLAAHDLPSHEAARLRAAAATGELKARKNPPRRNSVFNLPPVRSASGRRPRPPVSPSPSPSYTPPPPSQPTRVIETSNTEEVASRTLRSNSTRTRARNVSPHARTPTYSELTKRFASRHRSTPNEDSDSTDITTNSNVSSPNRSRPTRQSKRLREPSESDTDTNTNKRRKTDRSRTSDRRGDRSESNDGHSNRSESTDRSYEKGRTGNRRSYRDNSSYRLSKRDEISVGSNDNGDSRILRSSRGVPSDLRMDKGESIDRSANKGGIRNRPTYRVDSSDQSSERDEISDSSGNNNYTKILRGNRDVTSDQRTDREESSDRRDKKRVTRNRSSNKGDIGDQHSNRSDQQGRTVGRNGLNILPRNKKGYFIKRSKNSQNVGKIDKLRDVVKKLVQKENNSRNDEKNYQQRERNSWRNDKNDIILDGDAQQANKINRRKPHTRRLYNHNAT